MGYSPWGHKELGTTERLTHRDLTIVMGFPCGSAGKESPCNAGDLGSIPGVGKIPWRRERLPTLVFWPGEFHGLQSMESQRIGHN